MLRYCRFFVARYAGHGVVAAVMATGVAASVVVGCGAGDTAARNSGATVSAEPSAPAFDRAGLHETMTLARKSAPRPAIAFDTTATGASALPPRSAAGAPALAPSMVIRVATASVEVDSLEIAIESVRRIAESLGGWVGSTTVSTGAYEVRRAAIELKIPAATFDQALAGLQPLGKVESVSSNAEDVGEEFVDLTARTTNARRLESRLVTLLATRTGKLDDVLAVERELARVREEIERHEGRLRYLSTRVATSTLTVALHERAPLVNDTPGESVIAEAFKDAWRNLVHFVALFIASLGTVIPVLALGALGGWGWRRLRPHRRLRARSATESPT